MQKKPGFWHGLYQNLASQKLTVFVFFSLAAASLIGTLLPQGMSDAELQGRFSPGAAGFIKTLGLNDLYHTLWFQMLMLLLAINLIVCSIERLPKSLKLIKHQDERLKPEKLLKFALSRQIESRLSWEETASRLSKIVAREFAPVHKLPDTEDINAFAEKGRWSPLMVYIVHLSVLLVLVGAIMGSTLGFKGSMNITEGESSGEVILSSGDRAIELPFQMRCDKFDVTYYDTGTPKEFRSDLTIIDKGREVLKRSIRVNDPLEYKGITFYQASYGTTLKEASLELTDSDSGKTYQLTVPYRTETLIPGTNDKIEVAEYQENMAGFGPALGIVLLKNGQEEQSDGSWVLAERPDFHGNRIQNYRIKVSRKPEESSFTGIQVKRDPGIFLVYLGFTAMLVGIGLTFYMSHRRIWIWGSSDGEVVKVILAGRTNKNPLAFEQEFDQLATSLENGLKADG